MKTLSFDNREEWLAARRGKITGTRLKEIIVKRGSGRKIGFYEIIAERIAEPADETESPMDRGTRLEAEALQRFEKETGKKVDASLVMWMRDDDENIAISPDGIIGKTEAVETKCLSSARHIEAYLTKKIPDDYEYQALQYFIVNDKLRALHFAFYDPRIPVKDFFTIEIKRAEVQEQVNQYITYQRDMLVEIEQIVNSLTF